MRNVREILQQIRDFANDCANHGDDFPLCTENGDDLFYMNGNDGTEFDWEMNGHLCEFMKYYDDTQLGCVKLLVTEMGALKAYVYKHDYSFDDEPQKFFSTIGIDEAEMLMQYMDDAADCRCLYDAPLNKITN